MGKIFGISDLPVTIFTTPLEPVKIKEPYRPELPRKIFGKTAAKHNFNISNQIMPKKGLLARIVNGFKKII